MDFPTEDDEPTCQSLAPWLDEHDRPVTCAVPVEKEGDTHYGTHGGNGWTWDDVISMDRANRQMNPYYARCSCGWTYGEDGEIDSLLSIANEAAAHAAETGHLLRRH